MIAPPLLLAAAFGAFFEVHTVPLEKTDHAMAPVRATTFFAKADNDATADLFILQGNMLTIFSTADGMRETTLPVGVSAFDVADVDGDGKYEIIAVNGSDVLRVPLALQGETADPVRLFAADSFYTLAIPAPQPAVLMVPLGETGQLAVALPTREGEQLRGIDGSVIDTRPFRATRENFYVIDARSDGQSLTLPVRTQSSFETDIDIDVGTGTEASGVDARDRGADIYVGRATNARALREAVGDKPANWPWFVVHREKGEEIRAYCAVRESLSTLIRMSEDTADLGQSRGPIAALGPERQYAGAMVPITKGAPDFNGDGYADILLWNAPHPGISVDALLRAVVGRDWPITLTVHLFSPDKGRFEPMAATELTFRIPVTWFLTGLVPLRNYVLADFDGDKKTDLAMCTAENEYSMWRYGDGFAATPDERHTFKENITNVDQTADVSGNGKTSVVLRSDRYVYALYAK